MAGEPLGTCRGCGAALLDTVVDLGMSPLCQTVIAPQDAHRGEAFYPLRADVCRVCWLVQVGDSVPPEGLFQRDYPYFSSYSDSWLAHARDYAALMIGRLGLDAGSRVVEVGSNDGYLLRWFVERGIPSLGVDPGANLARAAAERGVETRVDFFGRRLAEELVAEGWSADLVAGKNVMAQVPDLGDFVAGLAGLVKRTGTVTIEFPHLVELIAHVEFDTIYHEHFSYFSLIATESLFARHGLVVTDVVQLPTHGGSLRVFARRADGDPDVSTAVKQLREHELELGVDALGWYADFADRVTAAKTALLRFLLDAREQGRTVVGYGAPGKGNTLLNACGIKPDLLAFTVDRNPAKQGVLLPGSRIPVHPPEAIAEARPDHVLILPWNLAEEIREQLAYVRDWGGTLLVPIPSVRELAW